MTKKFDLDVQALKDTKQTFVLLELPDMLYLYHWNEISFVALCRNTDFFLWTRCVIERVDMFGLRHFAPNAFKYLVSGFCLCSSAELLEMCGSLSCIYYTAMVLYSYAIIMVYNTHFIACTSAHSCSDPISQSCSVRTMKNWWSRSFLNHQQAQYWWTYVHCGIRFLTCW